MEGAGEAGLVPRRRGSQVQILSSPTNTGPRTQRALPRLLVILMGSGPRGVACLCINGNEYAKRQATKAGIGFTALDNGFATIDDPADVTRVQAICDGLTEPVIDALLRKWLARLPHPFTPADRAAGTATSCPSCRPSSP